MQRPDQTEYNPYFQRYINLVGEGDFDTLLKQNTTDTITFFADLPAYKHDYAYAPNKWTMKQVLMHLIDTERVFSYRVLVASRGDSVTQLQPYDDDLYASNTNIAGRNMESILEEFKTVRRGAEILFENLAETQSAFKANAVTHAITARALGYIMIGHVTHHLNVLKERY